MCRTRKNTAHHPPPVSSSSTKPGINGAKLKQRSQEALPDGKLNDQRRSGATVFLFFFFFCATEWGKSTTAAPHCNLSLHEPREERRDSSSQVAAQPPLAAHSVAHLVSVATQQCSRCGGRMKGGTLGRGGGGNKNTCRSAGETSRPAATVKPVSPLAAENASINAVSATFGSAAVFKRLALRSNFFFSWWEKAESSAICCTERLVPS